MQLVLIAGEGRDVGKTLLGERIVGMLASKGLQVGVVKHVHHGVDYRVKDTGRYLGAGASRVIAVGPDEYMLVEKKRLSLWQAVGLLEREVVVVEGFREQVGEVASRGGCVAFLRRDGSIEVEPGNMLLDNLEEAATYIVELLQEKRCRLTETLGSG